MKDQTGLGDASADGQWIERCTTQDTISIHTMRERCLPDQHGIGAFLDAFFRQPQDLTIVTIGGLVFLFSLELSTRSSVKRER